MLHIFNRRELCVTFSQQEYWRILDILKQNSIPYTVRILQQNGPDFTSRDYPGGERGVYVHKNDLERARALIGRAGARY
ncbi:hypothetical protein [Neobittarella massiliensis]|uniref:DUF2007 domain-containing protein n=2 Tax=Oscillospiraceae TaxID=216572 RepID=A0A8J6IMF7_9FIRM|nr:hypothetical protein [Neobittarella massiliensis]MBC3515197.1 hypothetical protein [Neobittarella massiliensis]SCJ62557.1 Uncharacterised protein [uncultured Anaerotruncus sp.]